MDPIRPRGRPRWRRIVVLTALAVLAATFAGCRSTPTVQKVQAAGQTVEVTAGSFYFDPAVIQLAQPGRLTLRIKNVARIEHNITVDSPEGTELTSTNLPPGETVEVTLNLSGTGVYPFHCNKPFHATLGMKGRIEVGQ